MTDQTSNPVVVTEDKIRKLLAGFFVSASGKKEVDGVTTLKYLFESDPFSGPWGKAAEIFVEKVGEPRFSKMFLDENILDTVLTGRLTPYFAKNIGAMGENWERRQVTFADLKSYVTNMKMARDIIDESRDKLVTIFEKAASDKPVDIVKQYREEYNSELITLDWLKSEVKAERLTAEQFEKICGKSYAK